MGHIKVFVTLFFLLAFAVCVTAQKGKTSRTLDNLDLIKMNNQAENLEPGFVTPNELAGYEFFKKGKLNGIRLGVSTKADIKNIFGSDCKNSCDYSSEWTIQIDYFEKGSVLISREFDKSRNTYTEKQYVPKPEVIGKIESIIFQPKKSVSFIEAAFSDKFSKSSFLETGYPTPVKNDILGVSLDYYGDSYGLQYFIFDQIVNNKLKDTFNLKSRFAKFQKGDLISIKYMIPEKLEDRFFIEEK